MYVEEETYSFVVIVLEISASMLNSWLLQFWKVGKKAIMIVRSYPRQRGSMKFTASTCYHNSIPQFDGTRRPIEPIEY